MKIYSRDEGSITEKLPSDDYPTMAAMLAQHTSPAMVGPWVHIFQIEVAAFAAQGQQDLGT